MRGGGFREVSSSQASVRSSSSRSSWSPEEIWRSTAPYRVQDVKCLDPYIATGRIAWPCGRCPACLRSRRRIWTHRIMLEAMQHAENSFVTLTYKEEKLPSGMSLSSEDLRNFLKRLRSRVPDERIRFYAVGEYGEQTGRPHYHLALFGLGCRLGPVTIGRGGERRCGCRGCSVVRDSWDCGHTVVGNLQEQSAAYIAGYVLKKMRGTWDINCGRVAPFARMSLKPGIGAGAVPDVASAVMQWKLEEKGDVPAGLRHGSNIMPLGRYLRNKLRSQVGLPEGCPDEVIEALRSGLLPVFEYASSNSHGSPEAYRASVKHAFAEVNGQLNVNLSKETRIKRGKL